MRRTPAVALPRPSARSRFAPRTADESEQHPTLMFVFVALILHFGLALFMRQVSFVSTLHAFLTLAVGLLVLPRAARQPEQLVYALAYIAGAELLWRSSKASIFYETGKYSLIVFSAIAVLLYRRKAAGRAWPLLFVVLLFPSLLVLPYFDRELIAFNLAGPVALGVASLFMSTVRLSLAQFKRMLLAVLLPAVSLGFLALFFTVTAEELVFTGVSLKATSSGVGPNQVSSVLGLAAVVAFCYALVEKRNKPLRIFMAVISLWMFAQAMLTFSRGGLWTAVGAVGLGVIFLIRDNRTRANVLGASLLALLFFLFIIFPALDSFTGNTLSQRLQDPSGTNRERLAQIDWQAFTENPLFGLGPGQLELYHALYYRLSAAHTEYSRLLGEHGSFGALVLLILAYVTYRRFFGKATVYTRSINVMFTMWALLFMAHSATRLVMVSLVFALPELTFDLEEEPDEKPPADSPATSYRSRRLG